MSLVMQILSMKQQRDQFNSQKPMRDAMLKLRKTQGELEANKLSMLNEINERLGPGIDASAQKINSKMQEMVLSGGGMMAGQAGAGGFDQGGMGVSDILAQAQMPEMPQPQQPGQGGGFLDNITQEDAVRYSMGGYPQLQDAMKFQQGEDRLDVTREGQRIRQSVADEIDADRDRSFGFDMMKWQKTQPGGANPITMSKSIKEESIPLWIHPDDLSSPQIGTTLDQAKDQGFVRVTTNTQSKVNDFRSVKVLVDRIQGMMSDVFPTTETWFQRITGGAERTFGAWAQTDVNAAALKSLLDGTQAALVRMFEKGTLTDKDIERAKKLNVELDDRADVAWTKIKGMQEFISDLQKGFLGGGKGRAKDPNEITDTDMDNM